MATRPGHVGALIQLFFSPLSGPYDHSPLPLSCFRAGGKKYEKALEWGVQVVNSTFLADIIHNGQLPSTVFPRYTSLGRPDEFDTGKSFEASRILGTESSFVLFVEGA